MNPTTKSPFKFLDPYMAEDRAFFFGRDKDIDQLYEKIFATNLLLIYGPSGAGKTSLIQCGLASRFQDTDWYDIHVRWRGDINQSMQTELQKHAITPLVAGNSFGKMLQSVYFDHFKPIFLVFDQFEELYILGTAQERLEFINSIDEIMNMDIPLKIIFSMREEYIAQLYDFEQRVPQLFKNRYRVEPMNEQNVSNVILKMSNYFNIKLEDPERTIEQIVENISSNGKIQLSYLQVYLDYLYTAYLKQED